MRLWSIAIGVAIWLLVLTADATLAAEITVTTAADDNGGTPAQCSLREAITAAIVNAITDGCAAGEAAPVVDTIKFNIGGGGVQTITINKIDNNNVALPEILDPMIIDGTTQPGFTGTPLIELRRGTGPGLEGTYALLVRAGGAGSTIKGLAISAGHSAPTPIRITTIPLAASASTAPTTSRSRGTGSACAPMAPQVAATPQT
jgi:CSLREA domain-containing protein